MVKELREMCIFSTHSVIRDPPFSRLDLISLPQSADLPEARPSGSDHSAVSLFSAAERLSISRKFGERLPAQRAVRSARQKEPDLSAPRPGRAPASPAASSFCRAGGARRPQSRREQGGLSQRSDMLRRVANTIIEQFAPTYVIVDETGQTLYFSIGNRKISAAGRRPAQSRHRRHGSPGFARRSARSTAPRQGNGPARDARPHRGADQRRYSDGLPRGRAGQRGKRDRLWYRVHRSRPDQDGR